MVGVYKVEDFWFVQERVFLKVPWFIDASEFFFPYNKQLQCNKLAMRNSTNKMKFIGGQTEIKLMQKELEDYYYFILAVILLRNRHMLTLAPV